MSVRKVILPSGAVRYEARPREPGEENPRKRRFKTQRDALAYERAAAGRREQARNGQAPQRRPDVTFDAYADDYLDQYESSPQSKRALQDRLPRARARFGKQRLRQIEPAEVRRWMASDDLQLLAPTTRRMTVKALRQVLNGAVRDGYLDKNPGSSEQVKLPKRATTITPFRSWDEVDAVALQADTYGPVIQFAAATGLRPQEWLALHWGSVDVEKRTALVCETVQNGHVQRGAKTHGSQRTILLSLRALDDVPRQVVDG